MHAKALALVASSFPLLATVVAESTPVILADTNRDGIVNEADTINKGYWTAERGAIFLPNIGDVNKRCVGDLQKSDKDLSSCNDASDDVVHDASYLAPLATLPLSNLSDDAYAIISTDVSSRDHVRLFYSNESREDATSWTYVAADHQFNVEQLRAGLILGIDGRTVVTGTQGWNGSVLVNFQVVDGEKNADDFVALQLAPVLTHYPLQAVQTILSEETEDEAQRLFLQGMEEGRGEAGVEQPLFLFNGTYDIWVQDFMEPGYSSMPGPDGPISIRVIIKSAQGSRTSGRQIFTRLRGPGVGGFAPAPDDASWQSIDSTGNFETIPPYTSSAGVRYPAGRIIMGKHYDQLPSSAMMDFIKAQGVQETLLLETGWLVVGHVDEFVQFLPYNNDLGFTIAIADTNLARQILFDAQTDGHGSMQVITEEKSLSPYGNFTIDEILNDVNFTQVNDFCQKFIDENLELLLAEIGLAQEDVIHVPVLYRESHFFKQDEFDNFTPESIGGVTLSALRENVANDTRVQAFLPNAINGIVLGDHYLAPKTWGPSVDDVDLFGAAVESAYGRAGMSVGFVDDYHSHHVNLGEIHCGSNTLRSTNLAWWA